MNARMLCSVTGVYGYLSGGYREKEMVYKVGISAFSKCNRAIKF